MFEIPRSKMSNKFQFNFSCASCVGGIIGVGLLDKALSAKVKGWKVDPYCPATNSSVSLIGMPGLRRNCTSNKN